MIDQPPAENLAEIIDLLAKLGAGDLEARCGCTGIDSLDAIVLGINMLGEELQAHQGELEATVAERTAELEAAAATASELQVHLRLAERQRAETLTLLETLQSNAPVGFGFVDREFRVVRVNESLAELNGMTAAEAIGRRVPEIVPQLWSQLEPVYRSVLEEGSAVVDVEIDGPNGPRSNSMRHRLANYYPVALDGEIIGVGIVVVDITERKLVEQQLEHRALHDSLTGLPNRTLLIDRLSHELVGTRRRGAHLGVIFLDVDDFKAVNDSLGHSAGDEVLRVFAHRIAEVIRPGDTAARFGGDEFVIVCDDVAARETEQIAVRVLGALSEPLVIGGTELVVTASLGVAVSSSDDDATPAGLLSEADIAMYRAKELGRGRVELFERT